MCECFKIGGPFIAEDPNCPAHGYEAQARERAQEEREQTLEERIKTLEKRVQSLEEELCRRPV